MYPVVEVYRRHGGKDLLDVVFNYINFHVYDALGGELPIKVTDGAGQSNFPMVVNTSFDVRAQRGGVSISYQVGRISRRQAEAFRDLYVGSLREMVERPQDAYEGYALLPEQDARQLEEWNGTEREYPVRCVHELFEEQARRTPEAEAVVCEGQRLSYGELNRRSNQLAWHLMSLGVGPDDVVGLCVERSVEMVVGILGILKAGGAYLPLDATYPPERSSYMLADARARGMVTQSSLKDSVPGSFSGWRVQLDDEWQQIGSQSSEELESRASAENLAYVIYRSGSTGTPQGVSVVHRGVANFLAWALAEFGRDTLSRVCATTSLNLDASVFEIQAPLCSGGCIELVRDLPMLAQLRPAEWHGGPLSAAPSAVAKLMNNESFRLAGIRTLVLAGGPSGVLAKQIRSTLPECRLIDAYGPAEATIYSTAAQIGEETKHGSIGRPIHNAQAYVLDERGDAAPIGVVGELYIGGAGLARGYVGRGGLTGDRFVPHPYVAGERVYRTVDLARWSERGELEFIGRADHQVQIRGHRIEPAEIETVLRAHARVSEAAVVGREDVPGEKRLVAYVVGADGHAPTEEELGAYLRQRMPEYMVPAAMVRLERLPLTEYGSVDRKALPAPEEFVRATPLMQAEEAKASRQDFLRSLVKQPELRHCILHLSQIWARVLRVERVGIWDDFFELGGHSLLATRVMAQIRETLQVELPLRALFESPRLVDLAKRIEQQRREEQGVRLPELRAQSRTGEVPLSFAQERLWFLDQLGLAGSAFHVPVQLRLEGPLEISALQRSLAELVRRHESLRTRFGMRDGEGVQIVDAAAGEFELWMEDLSGLPEEERENRALELQEEESSKRFDLARGSLFRAGVIRLGAEDHVLLLTMHHIVTDGWSMGIVMRELSALYGAYVTGQESPLGEPELQYADYAVWQREWMQGEVLEKEFGYWRKALAGVEPLELPWDRRRPAVPSFRGGAVGFEVAGELVEKLSELGREQGATLFMVLLAGIQVLLARWSGERDIVVGTPIAGRTHQRTEELVGFFVNMLALRTDVSGGPGFREVVRRVKEVTLNAYEHQDVPFEKVVEALQPDRDLSRQPLFQVSFALQNAPQEELQLPGLRASAMNGSSVDAKFDLSIALQLTGEGLRGCIEYATDVFERGTIERVGKRLVRLLEGAVQQPEKSIEELELLGEAERRLVVEEWNRTDREYPRQCVHELFEAQVRRTPDAVAVVYEEQSLSYGELNRRSNQLARHLVSMGSGRRWRSGCAWSAVWRWWSGSWGS